jgi:hypothetical protein
MTLRHPPGHRDARRRGPTTSATGMRQTTRQQRIPQDAIPTSKYSTLAAAAALARAAAAHLNEELDARRAIGELPTRELSQLLPVARFMHERLATLAAQEGGQ